jgi:tRNA nucleotidyltransferase (CCA-adding enzyme)
VSHAPTWSQDPRLEGLEVYRVGGAVRDELLGLTPAEHDFVVVGAAPEVLARRGFRAVGRDFPVFLHPDTGAEFALARTERKTAPGYAGFSFHTGPEVRLEDDLARRDLTVNAIAEARDGRQVDPYGGRSDLEAGILRHVSPAFVEDPVRLLRLARFATRFERFTIAPETLALCRRLVDSGEVDHLVPERVWQEMARALMHTRPSRFFEVLRLTGALARILPELDALWGVPQVAEYHPEIDAGIHTLLVLDQAASMNAPLAVRFAALVHDLGKALTPEAEWPKHHGHEQRGLAPISAVCDRLKIPREARELALLVGRHHLVCHRAAELRPSTVLELLERCDAFRRPQRFEQFLMACEADKRGRAGRADRPYPPAELLRRARAAAAAVEASALAAAGLQGPALGEALRRKRVAAIRALQSRR